MSDFQLAIGSTTRFKVKELFQGADAPTPFPVNWSVNDGAPLALAPIGGNPSLECDVTVPGNVSPATGFTLRAVIPNGGPAGTASVDVVFPVDSVQIVKE